MKRYGLTLCLRDDPAKIASYVEYHRAVWPGVLARLREVGVREMRIFLRERRLFMYIETDDDFEPGRDFARVNEDPTSREWNDLMATLQERAGSVGGRMVGADGARLRSQWKRCGSVVNPHTPITIGRLTAHGVAVECGQTIPPASTPCIAIHDPGHPESGAHVPTCRKLDFPQLHGGADQVSPYRVSSSRSCRDFSSITPGHRYAKSRTWRMRCLEEAREALERGSSRSATANTGLVRC